MDQRRRLFVPVGLIALLAAEAALPAGAWNPLFAKNSSRSMTGSMEPPVLVSPVAQRRPGIDQGPALSRRQVDALHDGKRLAGART